MNNTDALIKKLADTLSSSESKKPKAYDTQAEVRRIDGDTAWVHIPGGVDETPVQLTTSAKKGDIVQVRVSGGKAWLYGNQTNPPTDDTKANEVEKLAGPSIDFVKELEGKDVTVQSITAATGYIDDLYSKNITTDNINAATGYIKDLTADNITAQDISASSGYIKDLTAEHVSAEDIYSATGYIKDLTADHISAQDISAATGYINDLESYNITAQNISADHATVGNLETTYAKIGDLNAAKGRIDNLEANEVVVNDTLKAANAEIEYLSSDWISTDRLVLTGNNKNNYPPVQITEAEFNVNKTAYWTKDGDNYIQCTTSSVYDPDEQYYVRQTVKSIIEAINTANKSDPQVVVSNDKLIAASMDVAELSAITADMGELTTGKIKKGNNFINLDTSPASMEFKNASTWESATQGLQFDTQGNLNIKGRVTVTSGSNVPTITDEAYDGDNLLYGTKDPDPALSSVQPPSFKVVSGGNGTGTIETINDSPVSYFTKSFRITGNTSGNKDFKQLVPDLDKLFDTGEWLFSTYVRGIGGDATALIRVYPYYTYTQTVGTDWTKVSCIINKLSGTRQADFGFQFGITGAGSIEYIAPTLVRYTRGSHTLMSACVNGSPYASILAWSAEGRTNERWTIDTTATSLAKVKIGDTCRVAYKISDMGTADNRPYAYVVGEVTNTDDVYVYMTMHGLDSTIIDGGNILANSVGASQIKAHSINAYKMALSDSTNLAVANEMHPDSLYTDFDGGSNPIEISNGYMVKKTATQQYMMFTPYMPSSFKTGDELYFEMDVYSAAAGDVNLSAWGYDENTSNIISNTTVINLTTSVKHITGEIKLANANWGAKKKYLLGICDTRTTRSQIYVRNLVIRRKNGGELIVDGSITADKIATSAVTAKKIAIGDFNNYITVTENDSTSINPSDAEIVDGWVHKKNASATNIWVSQVLPNWTSDGEKYRITGVVKAPKAGRAYVTIFGRDATNAAIHSVGTTVLTLSANTEAYFDQVVSISANVASQLKSNIAISFYDGATGSVYQEGYFKDMKCERMSGGSLIVDGSISANHLSADAITIGMGGYNLLAGTQYMFNNGRPGTWSGKNFRDSGGTMSFINNITNIPSNKFMSAIRVTNATSSATQVGFYQDSVPVYIQSGTPVTMSFWCRASVADLTIRTLAVWYNASSCGTNVETSKTTTDWQYVTHTATLDTTISTTCAAGYVYIRNMPANGYFDVAGLKLEVGNRATEWSDDVPVSGVNMFGPGDCMTSLAGIGQSANTFTLTTKDGLPCAHISGQLAKEGLLTSSQRYTPQKNQFVSMSCDMKLDNYVAGTTNPYISLYFSGAQASDGSGWIGPRWCCCIINGEKKYGSGGNMADGINGKGWVHIEVTAVWYKDYETTTTIPCGYVYARDFTGDLYVRNVKFEFGHKCTPWSAYPLDGKTTDAAKTATNYISAYSSGIRIASATPGTQKQRLELTNSAAIFYTSDDKQRLKLNSGSGVTIGNEQAGHTIVTDQGMDIYDVNNKKRTGIASAGMNIYDTDGATSIAYFGTSMRLGKASSQHISVQNTALEIYKGAESTAANKMAVFGDGTAQIGPTANSKTRAVINTNGMEILTRDSNGTDTQIVNLGYGSGVTDTGSTGDAPYFSLGARYSGSGISIGNYSIAGGYKTIASKFGSVALGSSSDYVTKNAFSSINQIPPSSGEYTLEASSRHAFAEGNCTKATGDSSHAEGGGSIASNEYSHAEGKGTKATGSCSHSEGDSTLASGTDSHAQNCGTIAASDYQTAIGKFNKSDASNTYLFIIGNGSSASARSDAFTVDKNGNVNMAGECFSRTTKLQLGSYITSAVLTSTAKSLGFSIPTGRVYPSGTTITSMQFKMVVRASNPDGAGVYIVKGSNGGTETAIFDTSIQDRSFWNAVNYGLTPKPSMWTLNLYGGTNVYVYFTGSHNNYFTGTSSDAGLTSKLNNNACVALLTDIVVNLSVPSM